MKKNPRVLLCITGFVMLATNATAQIDNLNNMSAEWVRSGARNACLDGTDIIIYNPGGAAFMQPGFHASIGNQSLFRKPSHEYDLGFGKTKSQQDGSDLFVPNLFLSYNKSKWAVFAAVYIAGGGATANFPKGSINTDLVSLFTLDYYTGVYSAVKNQYLKASSFYLSSAIGASYKVNDKFSFGFYARNISAKNKTEAGFTLTNSPVSAPDAPLLYKTKDDASGFGVVVGVDVKPSDKVNITARYESKVKLDFKTKVIQDDLGRVTDGEKNRRDLPATASLGLAYSFSKRWKILYDFNYYFQSSADWGVFDQSAGNTELSKLAGDAICNGLAVEHNFTPKLLASIGIVYTIDNYKDRAKYYARLGAYEIVQENNTCINAGVAYSVSKKVKINAGLFHAFYPSRKVPSLLAGSVDVTINNSVTAFGLGVDLSF